MKLLTHILPRREGTVIVRNAAGAPFVFKADEAGDLVCDIDDVALVGKLLALGDAFEPAEVADYEAARSIVGSVVGDKADGEDDDDGDDDGDDGQEVIGDGLPLEANTPPKASARPRKAK